MSESFWEKLKKDQKTQLGVGLMLIGLVVFMILLAALSGGNNQQSRQTSQALPCYNRTLTIWAPFPENKILPIFQKFANRCVNFNYQIMSLEEIIDNLPKTIIQKNIPDIVFLDNFHLRKFQEFFQEAPESLIQNYQLFLQPEEQKWFDSWLGIPFFVDAIVPIYLKDYLYSISLYQPPETFSELEDFIAKLRILDQTGQLAFAPIALGGLREKRLGEIILALATLEVNKSNITREELRQALPKAIEKYLSYSDPRKPNYSYSINWSDGITSLLERKTAAVLSFYQDYLELKEKDPRLNLLIGKFYRKDEIPKKSNFIQVYNFAVFRSRNADISWVFLNWLYKNHLFELADALSWVPASMSALNYLDLQRKIILEEAITGEILNFVDLDELRYNIRNILELWQTNPSDAHKVLQFLETKIIPQKPQWLQEQL